MKDTVKVDTRLEQPRAGDVYLLCSDGLSGPVTDPDMLDILDGTQRPEDARPRGSSRAPTRTAAPTTSPSSWRAGCRALDSRPELVGLFAISARPSG